MSEGSAWVTLATNDSYCLGALVLAHSLRRANTAHPIVILITPGVTPIMRERLSHVFSEVINVDVLDSGDSAHLALLARPELGITFTKLHCWTLTQYNKCVFLDADTLVLQNCDELFEREELSAAPDVGWPDCFNSGVFVYRPSNETFTSLLEFAKKNGSFDGGDQGLLNQYFSSWATGDISKHLSFLYNVCSTSFYSYLPALKQYGENMKIVHFIGQVKPWLENFNWGSRTVGSGSGTLQGPLQFWWDIFIDQVHPVLDVAMPSCKGTGSCCSNGKCETVGEARSFYAPPPNSQFPWHRPITPPPTPDQHQHNIHAHFIDPWEIYQPQRQEQHHHNTGYVQHVQHNNQHVNNEHQHNNQHIHHGQQHIHHGQQHNEYVHHGHQHNEHVHHEQQHHNEYVHHGHQHNNDYVHHGQQHNEYVHHEPQHNNEYVHHDHHHNEYVHHEHQHNEHVHHEHQHNEHVHHDNNYHVEEQKNIYPPKPWYEYYTNEPEEQNNDSQNVNDTMSLCDISNCEPGGTNCSKEHLEENGCHESCQHDNINDDDDILSLIEEEVRPRHPYDNFYLIHRVVIDPQGRKMCMHEVPPKVPTPPPSPSPPPSPTPEEDTQGGVASALSQMTIGSSQGGSAMDEHLRRQGWETGNIDYMGADAFDNIWAKISQTLSIAPASSGPSAPEEPTPVPQPPPVHEKVEPVAPQECLTESRSSMESFEQVSSGVTPTVSDISISKPSSLENSSESSFTTVSSATPSQTKQSSALTEGAADNKQHTEDTQQQTVKPIDKLFCHLKPVADSDSLLTPESELEDAATIAQKIIASEEAIATPTVTSATPMTSPPICPILPQNVKDLIVETSLPDTPPISQSRGPVSLAQIGIFPANISEEQTQPTKVLTEETKPVKTIAEEPAVEAKCKIPLKEKSKPEEPVVKNKSVIVKPTVEDKSTPEVIKELSVPAKTSKVVETAPKLEEEATKVEPKTKSKKSKEEIRSVPESMPETPKLTEEKPVEKAKIEKTDEVKKTPKLSAQLSTEETKKAASKKTTKKVPKTPESESENAKLVCSLKTKDEPSKTVAELTLPADLENISLPKALEKAIIETVEKVETKASETGKETKKDCAPKEVETPKTEEATDGAAKVTTKKVVKKVVKKVPSTPKTESTDGAKESADSPVPPPRKKVVKPKDK